MILLILDFVEAVKEGTHLLEFSREYLLIRHTFLALMHVVLKTSAMFRVIDDLSIESLINDLEKFVLFDLLSLSLVGCRIV